MSNINWSITMASWEPLAKRVIPILAYRSVSQIVGRALQEGCDAMLEGDKHNPKDRYRTTGTTQFSVILDAALYPYVYAWRIDTLRKEMLKILKVKTLYFSSVAEVEPNV